MKRIITPIITALMALLLQGAAYAQCNNNNFTISATTVCGNEEVTFTIANPNPNATYYWNFGQGGGINAQGTVVTHTYPPKTFDRNYNVTAFNSAGSCVQTVTVLSTPDASLQANTGVMVDDHTIAFCGSTSDFPSFNLTVQNTSTTTAENTNYTIDWGDGTPVWSSPTFTTKQHTYATQGQFFLTLTVEGTGNCPSSTVVYEVFNSSDPGGSIVNTTNTVTTCYPNTVGYPILGTGNNIPGTTYEISISGELVAVFSHPPPDTFYHTFEETSCDQGYAPFDSDEFVIKMLVKSPCQDKQSFVTARLGTPPLAGFTMSPSVICEGENLYLVNTSDGSINSTNLCSEIINANWMIEPRTYNIVQGDTVNSEYLELELLEQVPYTITMWVENMCGVDTSVQVIEPGVTPQADAIGVLDHPFGCLPTIASFTNLSTQDSSIIYNWTVSPSAGAAFVNGTNANTFEPEIEFTGTGLYTVTLTVSNECGAPQWDTIFDINNKPGLFIPAIANQCTDTFVYVSNATIIGQPDVVTWTFTGGQPATYVGANPPPVTFAGTGSYAVSVNAVNDCGDSTYAVNFNLSDPINIDAGPDQMVCFNDAPITLGGSPAGGTWSGPGISGTNTFTPSSVATSPVTLVYTYDNGICTISDDIQMTIVRIDNLMAGTDETACVNDAPFQLSGENPAGGTWFGNGVTAPGGTFDPTVAGLGIHTIGYIYQEPVLGCRDTVFKEVEVLDIPVVVIMASDTGCVGGNIAFSADNISGGTAAWDFGDGNTASGFNVSHAYTATGIYWASVTITAGLGCTNTDSVMVQVIDVPSAYFVPDNPIGCGALVVNFDNQTAGHTDVSFWDFGNGTTSSDTDPINIYFATGTYNDTTYYVTLTSSNQCGSDSYSDSVYVTKVPVARFGTNVNTICPGQELHFNNISFNSPDSYFWDFGNGNTSTAANPPSQVFPVPEAADTIYVITLVVTNGCGSDTLEKNIRVKTVNVRSFFNTDPLQGCEPLTVNFINYSTLNAFPIWDFDDGNTSTLDTVQHIFQNDGVYNVSLAVDNGCSKDTSWVTINVLPGPDVEFDYPELGCAEDEVQFTNLSQSGFGFAWDFGDGSTSIENNPRHAYDGGGNYEVSLTGESQNGCTATFIADISILNRPLADFDASSNNFCEGGEVLFTNLSSGAENFLWDFGDGTISFEEDPVKRYANAGQYDVTLVANNDNFCFDTIIYPDVVQVFGTPVADFDYTQTTIGILYGEVEFTNLSQDAQTYSWEFGDGLASTETDPVHQYVASGQFEVTLVSENEYNCVDTLRRYIDVDFFGKLFVPNAFSPVLGAQTDASVFLPKGVGLIEYEMEIYSSYGELLWRSTELIDGQPAVGWDGTSNGKPLPQDVYVWKIRAMFDNGLTWEGTEVSDGVKTTVGTLTLIR